MTWLYILNKFILQFFFIRLTRHTQRVITEADIYEVSMAGSRGYGIGGMVNKWHQEQWFSIQCWVIPFSGWNRDYKYLGHGPKYYRLTKNKIIT